MELVKINEAILEEIKILRQIKSHLKDLAEKKAYCKGEYEKKLALTLMQLKNGVAMELEYKNLEGTFFGSFGRRDAILNTQIYDSTAGRGFNQLIVLNQRFNYALDDQVRGPNDQDLS